MAKHRYVKCVYINVTGKKQKKMSKKKEPQQKINQVLYNGKKLFANEINETLSNHPDWVLISTICYKEQLIAFYDINGNKNKIKHL